MTIIVRSTDDLETQLPPSQVRHVLYRMWDESGALLYAGISANAARRISEHRRDKDWFPDVRNITLEWHEDLHSVVRAEKRAIETEGPRYNDAGIKRAYIPKGEHSKTARKRESVAVNATMAHLAPARVKYYQARILYFCRQQPLDKLGRLHRKLLMAIIEGLFHHAYEEAIYAEYEVNGMAYEVPWATLSMWDGSPSMDDV